jgi:TIR domain
MINLDFVRNLKLSDYASFLAILLTVGAMTSSVVDKLYFGEGFLGSLTLVIAAIAGAASLYIARAAKSVTGHKRIFISYSSDQKPLAEDLRSALFQQGARVWLDEDSLKPGETISTDSAIESSNSVVAILSNNFDKNISDEISSAISKRVPVIALVPEGVDPKIKIEGISRVAHISEQNNLRKIAGEVVSQ